MSPQVPSLLLALLTVTAAQTPPADPPVQDPNCGLVPLPLPLPLLVGLVAADALMTLFIVGAVFACARPQRASQKPENNRVYINMPGRG
ncbi:hematopoietic cell signal transducer [Petaurus breviceps papuanus]|uniref:hematopoietic cell signal transducer n=1 Tax=Petaurus breviceps papuanus TaxID=3040969 RepID=UPI0036DD0FDD